MEKVMKSIARTFTVLTVWLLYGLSLKNIDEAHIWFKNTNYIEKLEYYNSDAYMIEIWSGMYAVLFSLVILIIFLVWAFNEDDEEENGGKQ